MDTTTLSTIVDMILRLGEGSKEAFIWYLVVTHLLPTIFSVLVCSGVLVTVFKVAKLYFFSNYSSQMLDTHLRYYNRLTNTTNLSSYVPVSVSDAVKIHASVVDLLQQATGKK